MNLPPVVSPAEWQAAHEALLAKEKEATRARDALGLGVSSVHAVTLRQAVTPDWLFGRMNASYRFLTYGAIPIGTLLGGFLAETIGLRAALLISALALLTSLVWVVFAPLAELREVPSARRMANHVAWFPLAWHPSFGATSSL